VGIVLAIGGMYEMLIPFLVLLGSIIPPVGGVIMADFWYRHRGKYPALASVQLPRYNLTGLGLCRGRGAGLRLAVGRAAGGYRRLGPVLHRHA
jgi:purine-cytosine permease-like protein